MPSLREWIVRTRDTWRPRRSDADLEAELRAHVELAREAAGGRADEGIAQAMESCRDQRGVPALESLARDLRHGARALRRTPAFTVVAVGTLALAIAATTTVFTMVDTVLLAPLPYPEPSRLVGVWHTAPGAPGLTAASGDLRLSDSMYFTYAEQNRVFDAIGVWGDGTVTVTGAGVPEQIRAVVVSDGVLQALGVPALIGRTLGPGDQKPGAPRVALLSYGYWMRRFGGDPSAVGRMLTVDGSPRQIVGVMPRGFTIADVKADIIGPVRFDRSQARLPGFGWRAIARLERGVTIADADADIARLVPIWMMSWPTLPGVDPHVYETWHITPAIRPLKTDIVGNVGTALWVLMATVGLVLLIACTNVATLVLVRTDDRQHELAIRAALGAGRARIVRALAIEAVLLAGVAATIGVVLSVIAIRWLTAVEPFNLPRVAEMTIGSRELAFAAGIAALAAVLIGLIPALRRAPQAVAMHLRGSGRTSTDTPGRQRGRNVLIVAQLAIAVVLLVSSGLMLRSFRALHAVQPGFTSPERQLSLVISIPNVLVPSAVRVAEVQKAIAGKVAALPGVASAGLISSVPMAGVETDWDVILAEGQRLSASEMPPLRVFQGVSPGVFRTLGTRVVAGREFTWGDLDARHRLVIISANLAREYWGSAEAAIGHRIQTLPNAPSYEVLGVVEDVRANGVQKPAPAIVYWPIYGESLYRAGVPNVERAFTLVVRTARAGTEAFATEVRQAIASVDPSVAIADVRTMADVYERSMARTSFTMATLLVAGALALALGVIGVYGVVSYSVSRRRREIGIRLALGGPPRALVGGFVQWGLRLAALAIPIGLLAAAGLARLMASLLFGVSPLDPATYVVVIVVLGLAAAAASYLPARRVAAIDPVRTLSA